MKDFRESDDLSRCLTSALPDDVILPHDAVHFKQSMNTHWAQQECEVVSACIVRLRDAQQLCTVVSIIKRKYDRRRKDKNKKKLKGLFAIRSSGHSSVAGAASIEGGVVIDLSLFCDVTPSEDGSSVIIGTGAKWMDVSKILDDKGLAVVRGRNSAVGVGGLTLGGELLSLLVFLIDLFYLIKGCASDMLLPTSIADKKASIGGLSFFSPRFGLVCSNIISYEIVLASGNMVAASESTNPDLWRALKGGANIFGIVTRFTARSFPSTKIWSGFLYLPAFQATKVLVALHEFVSRADMSQPDTTYEKNAAGPLVCFSYVFKLGVQAISVNLVYTKLPENEKKWPAC